MLLLCKERKKRQRIMADVFGFRAAPLGNSWRMSNDIFHNWQSIWRIANQAVPHVKHTTVGAFADLDMLM